MKRGRILVLGIAFMAAAGAAFLAKNMVGQPATRTVQVEKEVNTIRVLVARSDIKLGDSVSRGDLKWQAWPRNAATRGYITQQNKPKALSSYAGAIARAPFLAGEPIKEQKLIKASEGGVMAAILPAGMRAISTPIREETAAGGFILPNDRVDVIISRRVREGRKEQHVSDTVLSNVRVLAIGQNIEQKDGKKVASGKTATLELTPRQTEMMAQAQAMGEVSLSLRSLADSNPGKGNGPKTGSNRFGRSQSGHVKMLKYGAPSRAYGIN